MDLTQPACVVYSRQVCLISLSFTYVRRSICKFILSVLPVHLISSKSCYMLPVPCRVIHSEPSSQLWFGDMNQPIGLGKHKAALLPG